MTKRDLLMQSQECSETLPGWMGLALLLLTFVFADAAVIGWSAGLLSAGELLASTAAYLLICCGILITAYEMRQTEAESKGARANGMDRTADFSRSR